MKLTRKSATEPQQKEVTAGNAIDRRTFLKRSGLTVGGAAAAATLSPT
ncbi:MAG TPA: twin-arginine translocation signal domain-containing protein, partial [Gammaproteobacteria bacterium]|nr:twin-arginine translocation signal domain-containing protein [Gammaproteobacteria bacterium]